MKKLLLIKCVAFSCLAGTAISFASFDNAVKANTDVIDENIIKPLSHIRGEEVNTLPYSIQDLFKTDPYDYEKVFTLYESPAAMSSNNWKTLSPSDYAKKYFRTGTTSVVAIHNSKQISIPVLYTDNGDVADGTKLSLSFEGTYKTCYSVGETFNSTGLTFRVHGINKNFSPIYTNSKVNDISFNNSVISEGQTYVTAKSGNLSVNIPIYVGDASANTIIGYSVHGNYKTVYKDWDAFDKTNLKISAHYADGSASDVTSEVTYKSDEFDTTRSEKSAYQTALYEQYDAFHQINNVLKWEVKDGVNVESYDVQVSMNPEFTQTVYKAHVTEPMYQMDDIYTGYDYYWQVKVNEVGGASTKSPIYHFKTAATPRTLHIEGISNTRDIGGSMTPFGLMKEGYVYRGARVDEVTDNGKEKFKNELGIQTDIDLRTGGTEVGKNNPLDLPYYAGPVDMGMYQNYDPLINVDPKDRADKLAKLKKAIEPFTREESYPIYFHCTVGRDRTGTVGAIVDALMGVDPIEILRKYDMSVFSVTGHYDFDNHVNGLKNGIALITMINNHAGNTIYEKAESLVKEAGITDAQIQKIRDILTGKTNAKNSLKFLDNNDNYEGQVIVNFRQAGSGEQTVFTTPGSIVVSPIALKEGYAWYNGDEIVDLTKPVNESMYLVAKRVESYKVTIHYVKGEKADQIIEAKEGDVIQISDFAMNGVIPNAYLDTGKEISRYKVYRDATINLFFK